MEHGEPIGEGYFKKVYADSENPEKRIHAEFKMPLTNEQIKSAFYLNKIAHLLFPENIPEIHLAANERGDDPFATWHDRTGYLKADRVSTDETHDKLQTLHKKYFQEELTAEGDESERLLQEEISKKPEVKTFVSLAKASGLNIDSAGQNFSLKDGVVKYLELNPAWLKRNHEFYPSIYFDKEKLSAAIDKLPEDKKELAKTYFERLVSLCGNLLE
ncbi:MAG: hypothetical protein PHV93_01890 [Candidatus Pacebacteria bacterium]|nr:hypothetical protein [Candidatus Paceibacterota bacterium]